MIADPVSRSESHCGDVRCCTIAQSYAPIDVPPEGFRTACSGKPAYTSGCKQALGVRIVVTDRGATEEGYDT